MSRGRPQRSSPQTQAIDILGDEDASLLDIVDNVLNKGVVISGDLTIALAQVDLIYARLSLLLCAADRILPADQRAPARRHPSRHFRRPGTAEAGRHPGTRSNPRE